MKKLLSLSLVIAVLLAGLFVFTGCEKDEEKEDKKETDLSAVAGTYMGQYTKLVGDDEKNKDEEFYLELDKDGTGKHHRDDYAFNVEWSLDGTDFKMTEKFVGDPIEYTGTLKDGKLDIFNGDPDDDWTYEYVYEKDDSKTSKDDKDDDDDKKDNKLVPSVSKNEPLIATKTNKDSTLGEYEETVEIIFDNDIAKTIKFTMEFKDEENVEDVAELLKTSLYDSKDVSVTTKGKAVITTMDIETFMDDEDIDDEDISREALEEDLREDNYTIKSGASTKTTTTKTDDNKTTTGIDKRDDTDKKDDTKTTTTPSTTTTTPSTTTTTGLRPDFKKTMDDYEDFIDQYVEIMRKYKESNGKDTSILSDYTSYMNKYTELSKNLQKYNSSTMNSEEMAYYMEVVQRSSEKMKNAGN